LELWVFGIEGIGIFVLKYIGWHKYETYCEAKNLRVLCVFGGGKLVVLCKSQGSFPETILQKSEESKNKKPPKYLRALIIE
jgi:hypothetical protein